MIGLMFGKFAPLHKGHIHCINESLRYCDTLVVVVSYDQKFNDTLEDFWKFKLTLENRMGWLDEVFKDNSNVIITYVDESSLKGYPNSWEEYADLVYEAFQQVTNVSYPGIVFTSEWEYDDGIKTYFPESVHVVIDDNRTTVPISATNIREHLYLNWDYLPRSVQFTLSKKIVLIGTESTGKTTLSKRLAEHFIADLVPEYAKDYIIDVLDGDEQNLTNEHYMLFAEQQLESVKRLYTGSELIIIDTNAFITGFYQRLYEGHTTPELEELIRHESYDLVLYLDNDVVWVDDGMRYHGTPTLRQKSKVLFELLLLEYNIEYVKIDGTHEQRFKQAIKHISEVLQ